MQTGYYRCVRRIKGSDWKVGELGYVPVGDTNEFNVTLIQGEGEWTFPVETFLRAFEYAPDGAQERQREMLELMDDLHHQGERQVKLITRTDAPALPSPDSTPVKSKITEFVPSKALTLTNRDPNALALDLKKIKSMAAFTRKQIIKQQRALELMLKEQSLILEKQTRALTAQIEIATEAIYMINAYLGKDEELVRIKKGEPAPDDTKIAIRQMVLFMDEETAASDGWAEEGGMDYDDLREFDKWLLDPKHLQQVLPEPKGIVAFKPHRKTEHYSDNPYVDAQLNRLNHCLYILVRNGESLYRLCTNLWLDNVFFPRKNEFEHHFYETDFDSRRNRTVRKPMKPGSHSYMEAMKKAQADHRRFYTVLLLIQGILDRTKIFLPLPVDRINICDLNQSAQYVDLIIDGENLFSTGRPKFNDWLAKINSTINVGSRIVGNFHSSGYDSHHMYDQGRVRPKRAARPKSHVIHTIEEKTGEDWFLFRYSRNGETVYRGWGDWEGRPATRRASCSVRPTEKFYINFDEADPKDIEWYMNSRTERQEYQTMLPLLNVVLEMKKREVKEEAPFRKLLIGQIMKAHSVSLTTAEDAIDDLIKWWKFKNRNHRALKSDDAKALRMIVKEFGIRRALTGDAESLAKEAELVLKTVQRDNLLAVFRRPDGDYTVYFAHNNENVFVVEEKWTKDLCCPDSKKWQVVDRRHESWLPIWKHERFDKWQIGARPFEHLTDPEREEAVNVALAAISKNNGADLIQRDRKPWGLPLVISMTEKNHIKMYFGGSLSHQDKALRRSFMDNPEFNWIYVNWLKTKDGVKFKVEGLRCLDFGGVFRNVCSVMVEENFAPLKEDAPWKKERILRKFDDNILAAMDLLRKQAELSAERNKLHDPVWHCCKQIDAATDELWFEAEHAKFLEDYYDEDNTLWLEFKEDLRAPDHWPHWFDHAAEYLIERNVDLHGMTLAEAITRAKKHGYKFGKHNEFARELCEKLKDLVLDTNFGRDKEEIEEVVDMEVQDTEIVEEEIIEENSDD